jgi:hypothetical protein
VCPLHLAQFDEANQFVIADGADAQQEVIAPALTFPHPFGDLRVIFGEGRFSRQQA